MATSRRAEISSHDYHRVSLHTAARFIRRVKRITASSRLVAIYLMAVEARVGDNAADFADGVLIPGLRGLISSSSRVREFLRELHPIGIVHRNWPSVFAAASWRQHERRGFGQSHRGIIDKLPPWINIAPPDGPIETTCHGGTFRSGLFLGRIVCLNGKNNVGVGKEYATHDLREISSRRERCGTGSL